MADKPDFSKIWGSNSPLTPYTFTDSNYLEGWNFIGSVPPSRGMFDAWMNNTDTKQKYLVDTLKSLDTKNYTVDDTQVPSSNTGEAGTLLSGLAHMIKIVSGTSDWKTNPATSLESIATSLGYFASGSDVTWDGAKFTNKKLGITGLMAQNGYVNGGPNLGGLIIQWGILTFTYSQTTNNVRYYDATYAFPLQVTTTMYVGAMHLGGSTAIPAALCGTAVSNGSASLRFGTTYANSNTIQGFVMVIGIV